LSPIRIEFGGKLHLTRMEFRHSPRRGYCTVDGYPLRDGLRTAFGEDCLHARSVAYLNSAELCG
jgi:hypothetical protein